MKIIMNFFKRLKRGNIGVVCDSIAKYHKQTQKYERVYYSYLMSYMYKSEDKGGKYAYGVRMLTSGNIRNYVDLAVLVLTVEAAPKNQYFNETFEMFFSEITLYLREGNINEMYITGNNWQLVSDLLETK